MRGVATGTVEANGVSTAESLARLYADDGTRWGTGFQLSSLSSQPMLGPTSFGHAGSGGQLAFADAIIASVSRT